MNAYELADLIDSEDTLWMEGRLGDICNMLRQQADRITELERLVSDMIYEKASGVYGRPQANPEPQKVTLYIYNNTVDGKTWVDEHPNKMLYPEWKYMGKIEVMK